MTSVKEHSKHEQLKRQKSVKNVVSVIIYSLILFQTCITLFVLWNTKEDKVFYIVNWWVFVKCESKSSQLKEPKT